MDPVTLIVMALAAGASLGVKDVASSAVQDAYGALKGLVGRRLAGRTAGELVLTKYEEAPQTWQAPLRAELAESGAGQDEALVHAAQELMSLVDAAGTRSGKYVVDLRGAQGVQVGDGNVQHNVFRSPPGA
jgi:hypothetical protein